MKALVTLNFIFITDIEINMASLCDMRLLID